MRDVEESVDITRNRTFFLELLLLKVLLLASDAWEQFSALPLIGETGCTKILGLFVDENFRMVYTYVLSYNNWMFKY